MIEVVKYAKVYDKAALSRSIRFGKRPVRNHNFQIIRTEEADGIREKQSKSFHYRTAATWNDLPRNVADSKSVDTFKSNIDTVWKEDPFRFTFKTLLFVLSSQ